MHLCISKKIIIFITVKGCYPMACILRGIVECLEVGYVCGECIETHVLGIFHCNNSGLTHYALEEEVVRRVTLKNSKENQQMKKN